ncbi:MAG: GTP-binding protein TypA [Lentisphaerae bacterium GWF2_52_8]|nr:MAG: GTP-binding protein TypA [Lentisphaerae bacterium GWF2_52_8]
MNDKIRNIAIIAHVDHGKTTLVDEIIKQAKLFRSNQHVHECMLDSNDLERERGITILAKNISVRYRDVKINIIDTPGHSDFGGQVERVLNLADGVLLLVDAAEGPMPQTRFVLDKALKLNLKPIVIINKLDKQDARPDEVHEKVFDLFVELGASNEQIDFPLLYASGRSGWVVKNVDDPRESILPLMDAIIEHIPPPKVLEGPVQMQVATLDYSDYVGRIGIGRVYRGTLTAKQPLVVVKQRDGKIANAQLKQIFTFEGMERKEASSIPCGDLCGIAGIETIDIGDTIADAANPEAMAPITIDEPTVSMVFRVNDSPFYGQEGKYVSSRHIRERLLKEVQKDVALRVQELNDAFKVSGRGVLHLSVLAENMRREGYEMSVSKPHVIYKTIEDRKHEPIEVLCVDVPDESAGKVIEQVGMRRGEMFLMEQRGPRQLLEFNIPTRGLIGLRSKLMTASAGEAIVSHRFLKYAPYKGEVPHRTNGVMVSMSQGKAVPYAIDGLQLRGFFFIEPNEMTYEGMIVGEHCKDDDLVVNLQRAKQLSNMRAAGSDRNLKIAPAQRMSLEEALEYIDDDELVEITPKNVRLRKRYLTELERKRKGREKNPDDEE